MHSHADAGRHAREIGSPVPTKAFRRAESSVASPARAERNHHEGSSRLWDLPPGR